MAEHKTQFVEWGDESAEIDEGIADLILECWKAGIDTATSCESNTSQKLVWIQFFSAADAEQFIGIVAHKYDNRMNSLYQRIARIWSDNPMSYHPNDWIYSVSSVDFNLNHVINDEENTCEIVPTGKPDFLFYVSVRFPRADIGVVTRRLVNHNNKQLDRFEEKVKEAQCRMAGLKTGPS